MVRFGDIRPSLNGWGIGLITEEDKLYMYEFTHITVFQHHEKITLTADYFDDYFVKDIDVKDGGAVVYLDKGDE